MKIPEHKKCINCGGCCGPVPISKKEKEKIQRYIKLHNVKLILNEDILNCGFRQDGKCAIYPVRPIMCKLFGVTKGMKCDQGNTCEINGMAFMKDYKPMGLINELF